ncbi:hypothetical protein [Vreelandella gomseomensis]|uniref:Restriction endonuclease n=1 Tax=Vreelandella gomseomensis TaxID=370766 RepID=A0ABU1GEH7_9GAMM|nr:hypothetical protein [Halomonas gomseomensis]MDR5875890.1 hypothetical protein [Halomonas gomseomensis]
MRKASINAAMLFEVAYVRTEQILMGNSDENWDLYLKAALNRQERYFDAELPESFTEHDLGVARAASNNLVFALDKFKEWSGFSVELSPTIPGYQWIAEGQGDFSLGATLIEVKCTSKNFGSADYRQLLIYWLLSFAAAIEGKSKEWKSFVLLNPRSNKYIELEFDELISFSAAGRSKIEILELFNSIVSDQSNKVNI